MTESKEEKIRRLRREAQAYLAITDLPGSEAAGAESNAEMATILLDEAKRLEEQS